MSNTTAPPIFKLNFEQTEGTFKDITGNGYDATAHPTTNPTNAVTLITNDSVMGTCAQFPGATNGYCTIEKMQLPDNAFTNGITMTAWVKVKVYTLPYLLLMQLNSGNMVMQVNSLRELYYWCLGSKSSVLRSKPTLPLNSWCHVAVTVDHSGEVNMYIHGDQVELKSNLSEPNGSDHYQPLTAPSNSLKDKMIVGGQKFHGRMAWLALYDGVLSPQEIQNEMTERATTSSTFRQSFPLNFNLFTDDNGAENPIMFIEEQGDGENLNLQVTNNSASKSLSIVQPLSNGTVSESNYHFQLRFRPGTLSNAFYTLYTTKGPTTHEYPPLTTQAGWTSLLSKAQDGSGCDVMSFLYTGSTLPLCAAAQTIALTIPKVNASAVGGARNTNVEFRFDQLTLGTATTAISGYRSQNMSIVNHKGNKNIPLRAEIISMPSVLTYSKTGNGPHVSNAPKSELVFRIVNTGKDTVKFALPGAKDGTSYFILSFDVQPTGEDLAWALIDQTDINTNLKLEFSQPTTVATLTSDWSSEVISGKQVIEAPLENPSTLSLHAGTPVYIGQNSTTLAQILEIGDSSIYLYATNEIKSIENGDVVTLSPVDDRLIISGDNTLSSVNTIQRTITNNTLPELRQNEGFTFTLKGIECSLPAGASSIKINYYNIPGYWDGAFVLPVEKSPLLIQNNLIGINNQNPTATLDITERNDQLPLRIGTDQATNTEFTLHFSPSAPLTDLIPIGAAQYLDPNVYYSGDSTPSLSVWSGTNGQLTQEYVTLPGLSKGSTAQENSVAGQVVVFDTYFHVLLKGKSVIHLFAWATTTTLSREGTISTATGTGGTSVTSFGSPMAFNGKYFICYTNLGLTVFNHSSGTPLQLDYVSHFNNDSIQSTIPMAVSEDMVIASTPNKLYALTISDDGSLVKSGSWTVPIGNSVYLKGTTALVNTTSAFYIIDASTAGSTPQKIENTATYCQGVAIVDNILVIPGFSISDQLELYFYNLTNLELLKKVNTILKAPCRIGGVDDIFFVSGIDSSLQNSTFFCQYDDLTQLFGGLNTSIGAEHVNIATLLPNKQSYLSLPYPGGTVERGIQIGPTISSTSAGLSIAVKEGSTVDPMVINGPAGDSVFVVGQNGHVGIGTDNPQAPLQVKNFAGINQTTYAYLTIPNLPHFIGNTTAAGSISGGNNDFQISIVSEYAVLAKFFIANSDIRIKESISPSYNSRDLSTVLGIEIKDFSYIDFIGNGTIRKKGLIAQQVKEVFPQAVSDQNTDFIPDIYAMATDLGWQPLTKQLRVGLEKEHDLAIGDKVRLIAEKGFEEKKVVAVPDAKSFVVAEWEKPVEKLFVFGKEVHDFHTVDYDQVAMLGVSAIQALHAEVEDLKKENEALKSQMQSEMAELKAEWAAFKSSITKQHQN